MEHVTAGQEWFVGGDTPVAAAVAGTVALGDESPVDTELGELDLLAAAWADAMTAHAAGLVIGDQDDAAGTDWHQNIRDTTAAGACWSRVRILDYPLTEYSRYELHGYQGNAIFGEHINVADRAWSLELGGLREDFWQFDRSIVRMVYDAAGHFLHPGLVDDPDKVSRLRAARAVAEHHAVPLTEFLADYEPGLIA